jgi:Fur family iron response transcriptional regulator
VISGISVSLATVYNTLHQFTEAGLLRETVVEPGRSCRHRHGRPPSFRL